MKFESRMNKKTNLMEAMATQEVSIESIETTSKTNSNGKAFGFVHGRTSTGALVTGIAYDKTATAHGGLAVGTKVVLESLAADVVAGFNNRWQLTLPTASPVLAADIAAAQAFLASLK